MDYIISHNNLDFDGLSSMIAAKSLYEGAIIVLPANKERGVSNFLTLYRHFIDFSKERYVRRETIRRVIIVDTQDPTKLGIFKEYFYNPKIRKIIFDHHPKVFKKSEYKKYNIQLNHTDLGANVTQLVERLRRRRIKISPFMATLFGLGIYDDTGSLTFTSTTQRDLGAAAWLMGQKMSLSFIQDFIRPPLGYEQMQLLNTLVDSLRQKKIKGINVSFAFAELDTYMGDLAMLAHKIRDLENINVLFLIVKMGSRVHVVARSRAVMLNLSRVFDTLGGGGHPTAASAVLKSENIDNAFELVCKAIENEASHPRTAKDVMTSPVKYISSSGTVSDARSLMLRYNISGIPVVDSTELVGIISRGDIDKAAHHNLSHAPVKAFMTTDVITVQPETSVNEIKKLLLTNHIARVPVVNTNNQIIGIITGTDLLRIIHDDLISEPLSIYDNESNLHLKERGYISERVLKVLPPEKLNFLRQAGKLAQSLSMKLFIAGGLVRDIMLFYKGIIRDPEIFSNMDIDFVVQGDGIEFAQKLSQKFNGATKFYQEFQTATVNIQDLNEIDVATARFEYYRHPGALPSIEAGSIRNDLQRRDFSINAMAIALNPDNFGALLDYFEGQNDIDSRNIRILHNLSFIEDPTRMFRAVRFAARYDFKIEPRTRSLINNIVENNELKDISRGRLKSELIQVLKEFSAGKACRFLDKYGILNRFWPEIKFDQKLLSGFNRAGSLILKWYKAEIISYCDIKVDWIKLYILFSNLDVSECLSLSEKLFFSRKDLDRIQAFNTLNTKFLGKRHLKTSMPGDYYFDFKTLDLNQIIATAALGNEVFQKKVQEYLEFYSNVILAITGSDVIDAGVKQGPEIKNILNKLIKLVVDKKIPNDSELLKKEILKIV